MDQPMVVALIAITLIVVLVVATLRRTSRSTSLAPARLGPSWSPSGSEDDPALAQERVEDRRARIDAVTARTGLPLDRVEPVLAAWDEYLAVLGLQQLPAGHEYRFYDPYVPPVAERGPDGPVPDRARVAMEVAGRIGMPQSEATSVLDVDAALSEERDPAS